MPVLFFFSNLGNIHLCVDRFGPSASLLFQHRTKLPSVEREVSCALENLFDSYSRPTGTMMNIPQGHRSGSGRRRSLSSFQQPGPTTTRTAGSTSGESRQSSLGGSASHNKSHAATTTTTTTTTTRATTAVEDQLRAMLASEAVYTPSLCAQATQSSSQTRPTGSNGTNTTLSHGQQDEQMPMQTQTAGEWRSKICEWCYRVIDHFRYDREVVSVAMNFFDRYLVLVGSAGAAGVNSGVGSGSSSAVGIDIDSRTYQLAAMTALYVATKLHADRVDPLPATTTEPMSASTPQRQARVQPSSSSAACSSTARPTRPSNLNTTDHRRSSVNDNLVQHGLPSTLPPTPDAPTKVHRSKLRLSSFVELSRGQFSAQDITDMERQLLHVLRWRVNPPTPMVLVSHLLRVMPLFGRPDGTTTTTAVKGTDPTSLQHRTLVLHVLHELSRYLTELSICLPTTISSTHTSSEMAYVSILLSLDLLSDVTAVPPAVRVEYMRRLDWLSDGRLNTRRTKVVELKDKVGRAFVPDMLQDSLAAAMGVGGEGGSGGSNGSGGHPILIARDAGLLSEEVERRCGGRCFTPTQTPAAAAEMEVEFNPPPSEPAIIAANGINTSFNRSDSLIVSSNASLAGSSVDSFDDDIDVNTDDGDDKALEYTLIDPETGRNRSVNCVAEQTVLQLQQSRRDSSNKIAKRSDKYAHHQHPFHVNSATATAGPPETTLENTISAGTAPPPGHVRHSSCSSWMSDSSESPHSVIAEALNAAAAMGGGGGSGPSATTGQARPPTHHQAHHQAPAQGYLL